MGPVVIEIVNSKEKLDTLLLCSDEGVDEGLITLEKARVIKYRHTG